MRLLMVKGGSTVGSEHKTRAGNKAVCANRKAD